MSHIYRLSNLSTFFVSHSKAEVARSNRAGQAINTLLWAGTKNHVRSFLSTSAFAGAHGGEKVAVKILKTRIIKSA